MKPTQITMQIVKNLGNYETARLECTYTLDEGDEVLMSFRNARYELEKAYAAAYEKKQPATREELTVTHPQFTPVCKALYENRVDLTELQKFYVINKEAFEYFVKHKLI
jgi:hypothetical protein